MAETLAELVPLLEALVDHYLAHGCPCRFPRFRTHQSRDTKDVGAPAWTTPEQQALIELFDRKVPLNGKKNRGTGHVGTCARCGASITRWGDEPFRDAWYESMTIRANPDSQDLGAPAKPPVPRANEFYSVGPSTGDAAVIVSIHWPKLPLDAWLAYMRALK